MKIICKSVSGRNLDRLNCSALLNNLNEKVSQIAMALGITKLNTVIYTIGFFFVFCFCFFFLVQTDRQFNGKVGSNI